MNPWALVGGFVAALLVVWLAYSEGRDAGLAEGEQKRAEAVAKKSKEMIALQEKHSASIREFQLKLSKVEKQANEKIRKLLLENIELKTWWETIIPPFAAGYAWGVYDDLGNNPLPGGSVSFSTRAN